MPALDPRLKKWILVAAKLGVLLLVGWFVHGTLAKAFHQIGERAWQLSPAWLALSGLFYALGLIPAGLFWYVVMRAMGQEPRIGETLRAYCIGHLGKYVPGKAMVVVLRTGLVRSERVNTGVAAASVFYETLTMMAVGACIAAGILAVKIKQGALDDLTGGVTPQLLFWGTIGMAGVAGLPIVPPIFRRLTRLAGVGRSDPAVGEKLKGLGFGALGLGWLTMALSWVLLGASLWATFRAMGIDRLSLFSQLDDYTAAVAVAMVAGFLAMIPAGLGVRDVILIALVVRLFGVGEAEALVAAALMRVVWLAVELAISGVLYLGMFVRRAAPATGASPASQPAMKPSLYSLEVGSHEAVDSHSGLQRGREP